MEIERAGPLVLDTLTKACSQSTGVLKPAEHQLQQWETQPGFYSILSSIFGKHDIDVNVRWLAVLYTKNGVDRYWRRAAPHAIAEEEKEDIRQRLLSIFNEPSPQVATQLAVLVAKIARLDCPRTWPTLLPTLLQTIRCQDQLLQQRALLILHHVTKTLASKRLAPDRKLFEDLTNEIFNYIYSMWTDQLEDFLGQASQHSEGMMMAIDRALLTLRILRRLVTFGFREPGEKSEAVNFLNTVFVKLEPMLDCRRSMWGNHRMVEKCEKMIVLLTKVLLDMLEQHPICYVQFIHKTLEFVVNYNFTQTGLLFERFTVNSFNLMKNILMNDSYRPAKHEVEPETVKMQAYKIKMNFFTYNTLNEICQRLISQYFLLTSDDLSTWDNDPEEFFQEEVGDSYKFSLRPCTETLFLSLFKEFRMTLTSVVLEMIQAVQGPCRTDDMVAILRKDAVYNAVGLAAFDLFDEINFDEWFTTHLVQEMQVKDINNRIIRRRAIGVAGHWVGVKMSMALRPTLYQAILPLLHKDEDLVVRLEAANTLKLVDDFEFNVEQFLPYLNPSFVLLFHLLKEVNECDTKMQILHVISFVIERVGAQIRPFASSLISYLPSLWHESEDHNMLRCAILTTLIHLVQGFCSDSSAMYDFLLPVIQMSTDVAQPQHVYLLEDGLELWHVTLINSPAMTSSLLTVFHNMSPLLGLGTENLRICLKIIETYIMLGAREFMERYSQDLVKSLTSLMTDIRTEGLLLILKIIELVFKSFPSEGPEVFRCVLPNILQAILDKDEHPVVMSLYLTLFGRIILQNQDFFWKFLDQTAADTSKDSKELLKSLLSAWMDTFDSMTQPERRKLSALALASLLSMNVGNVMFEMFSGIVTLCVEVLHDVCRVPVDEDAFIQMDALVLSDHDYNPSQENETEHDKRKCKLTREDPVHSIPLKDYVFSQLNACQQLHGQATFDMMMQTVDSEILRQLRQFSSC